MDLAGAVALVTGASSGIGRACAQRLAQRGARLLLAGRDGAALAEVAGETGGQPLVVDLAQPGGAERLAGSALGVAGHVDVLVNNAGVGWAGPVSRMAGPDIDLLVAVDLTAPLQLTRALLPDMLRRRRGHVVFVTSIAGVTGVANEAVYAATKAGLGTFAESLRLEARGTGVGVSTVAPGVIATAFFDRRNEPYRRRWPRPIAADRVATALVHAVENDRADVFVPRWLSGAARLHGTAPALYRALAARFG